MSAIVTLVSKRQLGQASDLVGFNYRMMLAIFGVNFGDVRVAAKVEVVIIMKMQCSEICFAKTRCICQHGLKYGVQLAGELRSPAAPPMSRSAVLMTRKIAGALAQLVKQPRVLDGDDGLRGKVPDQFDLLFGKRTDFLPEDTNRPDQLAHPSASARR